MVEHDAGLHPESAEQVRVSQMESHGAECRQVARRFWIFGHIGHNNGLFVRDHDWFGSARNWFLVEFHDPIIFSTGTFSRPVCPETLSFECERRGCGHS